MDSESIFNSDIAPDCDVYYQFLGSINQAAISNGVSRRGIAERVNAALKTDEVVLQESALNRFLAPGSNDYLPAHILPALLWSVGSIEPINLLLKPLMFRAYDTRAMLLKQHKELELQKQQISKRQAEIEQNLTLTI
ncbi:hypothetical protein J8M21_20765 [Pseudoalteromonas luteoviolacea]|uniref:hypothetical protein n=1 Tax=Pseudoalteromonas luteoviolacea TaxID=43657 RepID=UPI001B3A3FE9|nr:hypothetical protein [Pseudoalteromonas luteoviolacea]MBQ4879654.1 hypothetical protein [Pseudoalteromonas luteoviolacea]MBQ4908672.1 hypothetical protein [Pseudoalteromonas luteoviolacea]